MKENGGLFKHFNKCTGRASPASVIVGYEGSPSFRNRRLSISPQFAGREGGGTGPSYGYSRQIDLHCNAGAGPPVNK